SPDLLDGSQHVSFLGSNGLALLDAHYQVPLSLILDDAVAAKPIDETELRQELEKKLGARVQLASFKELSQQILGKSVYASAMILGAAYQLCMFPFSLEDMRRAIESAVRGGEGKT